VFDEDARELLLGAGNTHGFVEVREQHMLGYIRLNLTGGAAQDVFERRSGRH
jgi:hypothetical protein